VTTGSPRPPPGSRPNGWYCAARPARKGSRASCGSRCQSKYSSTPCVAVRAQRCPSGTSRLKSSPPLGHEAEKDQLIPYGDFGVDPSTPKAAGSLDLVLVVDTTGSMGSTIESVKAMTAGLVDLLAANSASFRVALVPTRTSPKRAGTHTPAASRCHSPATRPPSKRASTRWLRTAEETGRSRSTRACRPRSGCRGGPA
jgi:hypothetical protein